MASNNQFDMISNLPQDVIQCILERLRLKDAVKTSALSKSWRYSWCSITKVVFDIVFFRQVKIHERSTLTQKILQQHDGRLHSFTIDARYYAFSDYVELGRTILKFVSSKGVECLKITMRKYRNNHIFTPLFSFSVLTNLTIGNSLFFVPDSSFRGFPRLVNLKFKHVEFYDNSLEDLMKKCPLLESLSLVGCSFVTIASHNLESLSVVEGGECRLILPPTIQNSLKNIYFKHLDSNIQVSLATNVLDIEIFFTPWASWGDEFRKFVKLLEFCIGRMQLRHVEYLNMKLRSGREEELDIVNMLLSETPSLKEIVVVDRSYKYESEDKNNCRLQSILDKFQFRRL